MLGAVAATAPSIFSFVPSEQLFSSDGDVCGDNSACWLNEF